MIRYVSASAAVVQHRADRTGFCWCNLRHWFHANQPGTEQQSRAHGVLCCAGPRASFFNLWQKQVCAKRDFFGPQGSRDDARKMGQCGKVFPPVSRCACKDAVPSPFTSCGRRTRAPGAALGQTAALLDHYIVFRRLTRIFALVLIYFTVPPWPGDMRCPIQQYNKKTIVTIKSTHLRRTSRTEKKRFPLFPSCPAFRNRQTGMVATEICVPRERWSLRKLKIQPTYILVFSIHPSRCTYLVPVTSKGLHKTC